MSCGPSLESAGSRAFCMNRWLKVIFTVSIFLVSSAVNAAGTCTQPLGNLNEDETVNVVDVQCSILATLAWTDNNAPNDTPSCLSGGIDTADLTCDGSVSVADVLLCAHLAVGVTLDPFVDSDGSGVPDSCEQAGGCACALCSSPPVQGANCPISCTPGAPNAVSVVYAPFVGEILNPERGLTLNQTGRLAEGKGELSSKRLTEIRDVLGLRHIIRIFDLEHYHTQAQLPASVLGQVIFDLKSLREKGLKAIVRFRYFTSNEPSKDATPDVVKAHLAQLTPILQEHADVIVAMQAGFIGKYGEWWLTNDLFGNKKSWLEDSVQMAVRKEVVDAMLEALPSGRQVYLRAPMYKQALYGMDTPCMDGSSSARIGHFNDCFLASEDDLGTYENVLEEKTWLAEDSKCTGVGGELCTLPSDPERIECPSARAETGLFHWSYLNGFNFESTVWQGDQTLIPEGAQWKFRAESTPPSSNWTTLDFDDSSWDEGPAVLGYSKYDDLYSTSIGDGYGGENDFTTAFFRHTFEVEDVDVLSTLNLQVLRDDGAVVYLNGTEVARSNVPPDSTADTPALQSTFYPLTFITFPLPLDLLVPGENILAVEVHNSIKGGGDIYFDARLVASLLGDDRYDCYEEIRTGLGYRFTLHESIGPELVSTGESLELALKLENQGFAGTLNERDVHLVFRHQDTGEEWGLTLEEDPRTWLPSLGAFTLQVSVVVPINMPPGEYGLFLHLADPAPALRHRPLYSIRLANEGIWEEETGYNSLLRTVTVSQSEGPSVLSEGLAVLQLQDFAFCGDGVVQGSEECDAPGVHSEVCDYGETQCAPVCSVQCTWSNPLTTFCGDNVVDLLHGEVCDGEPGCVNCQWE